MKLQGAVRVLVLILALLFGQQVYAVDYSVLSKSENYQIQNKAQNSELSEDVEAYIVFLGTQPLDKKSDTQNIDVNLINRLTKMFRLGQVRSDLVRKHESAFIAHSGSFNNTLVQSAPYMHFIVSEVAKRNMPGEIALLPFIESRFTPKATSHVGARGIWQFMPATGRQYGLDRTNLYDGRDDFYAATIAALNYLEYLYSLFNDWSLAIAAYNAGENRVQRAINEAKARGLQPTFDNLRLPKETRNYVPKLLAVSNVIKNSDAYNVPLTNLANQPYFKNIQVKHPIALETVAQLANVSLAEIQKLNPSYKASIYVPNSNRSLLIPRSSYRSFYDNYNHMQRKDPSNWYALKLASDQTLDSLAQTLNISVSDLKSYNNISSGTISEGMTVFFRLKKNRNLAEVVPGQFSVVSLSEFESPVSSQKSRNILVVSNKRAMKPDYQATVVDNTNPTPRANELIIKVSNKRDISSATTNQNSNMIKASYKKSAEKLIKPMDDNSKTGFIKP